MFDEAARRAPGSCLLAGERDALLAEREPLLHAKAMLFINDRQLEVFEGDRFFDQSMGADV